MRSFSLALLTSVVASPLMAQETREMDAHVHGVSKLELAVEDGVIEMNLHAPGMDIVGFEHEESSAEDKDAVEAAIRTLLVPENVVSLPEAATCRLTEVLAHLHGAGDGHHHEEGEEHEHEEEHAEGEDHDHAEGEDHAHEDGAEHTEFHIRYIFACDTSAELKVIAFPFFEKFENAQEIEAEYVTAAGAGAAEVTRDAPELTLN